MHTHVEERLSPYTTVQLFNVVADVESYPEFIPWVTAARILSRNDNEMVAELAIQFKGFSHQYTSNIRLERPETPANEGRILVKLVEGPFKHLYNNWHFIPRTRGCSIYFDIDFAFDSKMLDTLMGFIFGRAVRKMVGAFEDRAEALYG